MDAETSIRSLTSIEEMEKVEELQRIIWPGSEIEIVPVHLIMTIARNGGIVLGAFEGEELRGYVFGFLGITISGGIWPTFYDAIGLSTFVILTDLDSIN